MIEKCSGAQVLLKVLVDRAIVAASDAKMAAHKTVASVAIFVPTWCISGR
jgi:hypothetical protein